MHILEHENRRRVRLELLDQGGAHLVGPRPAFHDCCEVALGRAGDVEQRSEWTRREQCIAGPRQEPCRPRVLVAEHSHERRLAHTGLAAHENEPA